MVTHDTYSCTHDGPSQAVAAYGNAAPLSAFGRDWHMVLFVSQVARVLLPEAASASTDAQL